MSETLNAQQIITLFKQSYEKIMEGLDMLKAIHTESDIEPIMGHDGFRNQLVNGTFSARAITSETVAAHMDENTILQTLAALLTNPADKPRYHSETIASALQRTHTSMKKELGALNYPDTDSEEMACDGLSSINRGIRGLLEVTHAATMLCMERNILPDVELSARGR